MDLSALGGVKNMTKEEAEDMLRNMPAEKRAHYERMQKGMVDLAHLASKLQPSNNPDAPVSTMAVVQALAGCPVMRQVGEEADDEQVGLVESELIDLCAFDTKQLSTLEIVTRRNVILLYWHMHSQKLETLEGGLTEELQHLRARANQLGTKLLIQAQMLMPQQRWVQQTLAVARVSALMATALWSHSDKEASKLMTTILVSD